ncbi:MAG: agmatinase [bacterium]|nr:agmatinase [bacterium]
MCATDDYTRCDWVMIGLPYDGTCSNKPGARFASQAMRTASWGLEEYSPIADRDFNDVKFFDAGDLEFSLGNRESSLNLIENNVREILKDGKKSFGIGGEHLVTYPEIKAYKEKYPNLAVVHFDAHCDLREDYLGEKLSHACVMRRVVELVGKENLYQIGIRSGEIEEYRWMKENNTLISSMEKASEIFGKIKDQPVFITLDVDVLDTSVMPATGTQEAGGMTVNELISWLLLLRKNNVVGMDLVELSPDYDASGASTATAAKLAREMLIYFG